MFVKPIVEADCKLSLRSRQLNVRATAQKGEAITIRANAVALGRSRTAGSDGAAQ